MGVTRFLILGTGFFEIWALRIWLGIVRVLNPKP